MSVSTSETSLPELIDSPAGTPLADVVITTHPLDDLLQSAPAHDEDGRTAVVDAVTSKWDSWSPAEQFRAAMAIHDYSAYRQDCDALRDGIVSALDNTQPWLPTLLGILEWNYDIPGVKLRQYWAWQEFQKLDVWQ